MKPTYLTKPLIAQPYGSDLADFGDFLATFTDSDDDFAMPTDVFMCSSVPLVAYDDDEFVSEVEAFFDAADTEVEAEAEKEKRKPEVDPGTRPAGTGSRRPSFSDFYQTDDFDSAMDKALADAKAEAARRRAKR